MKNLPLERFGAGPGAARKKSLAVPWQHVVAYPVTLSHPGHATGASVTRGYKGIQGDTRGYKGQVAQTPCRLEA